MKVYRDPSSVSDVGTTAKQDSWNSDMRFVWAILFPCSLVRVIAAVVRQETFGAEPTIALLVVLGGAVMAALHVARALRQRYTAH